MLGAFTRTEFLYTSVLRVASGPRVKLSGCKSALNPQWFILLTILRRWSRCSVTLCCSVVHSTRRFVLSLVLCYFVLVLFSPFSIAITSRCEERANLNAFDTFVRFAPVWFCLFPLPLGIWEGLRVVIVALPELFSYLFPKNTKNDSMEKSWKLGQPAKNRQIAYVMIRGPLSSTRPRENVTYYWF